MSLDGAMVVGIMLVAVVIVIVIGVVVIVINEFVVHVMLRVSEFQQDARVLLGFQHQ